MLDTRDKVLEDHVKGDIEDQMKKPKWKQRLDISEALLLGEEDIKKKDELIKDYFVGARKLMRGELQKMGDEISLCIDGIGEIIGDRFMAEDRLLRKGIDSYLKKQEGEI